MDEEEERFSRFVHARSSDFRRTAWLLTGEYPAADDLVQTALIKTWQRWKSVRLRDDPEAYVRRVIVTTFLAWRRRKWVGELALGWLPDRAATYDLGDRVVAHAALVEALLELPAQQRAVLVLRYFDDLSEQATAAALGCSLGTVKTHASRGLKALRANPAVAATIPVGER